ncbi:hypothetical protein [Kitasatospora sp. NPDC090308]|uniref:hypothetical protein n=1 Tax=Kitasatospora sp. NPDC090308 TaxID=3364082 RepID=UPI0037F289CC
MIRQWSPCTTEAGFDCPDPLAALSDPRWRRTPRPTPQELRTATADAGYRRQVIEADPEATAKAKAAVEFQVAAAARVTAGRATGRPGAAADGTSQPFASRANHPDSR